MVPLPSASTAPSLISPLLSPSSWDGNGRTFVDHVGQLGLGRVLPQAPHDRAELFGRDGTILRSDQLGHPTRERAGARGGEGED